jgi:hypothetical protein
VERFLGFYQPKFGITRWPTIFWDQEIVQYVTNACVMIMHNMIIENKHEFFWTMASTTWWNNWCHRVDVETELRAFLRCTIIFEIQMCTKIFKKISLSNGEHVMAKKTH